MKFKDMEDISTGKTYEVSNSEFYKGVTYAKKDGLLYSTADKDFSEISFKYISELQFEEIKQPMTIIEAVEWMNEKPLENKATFNGKTYLFNKLLFTYEYRLIVTTTYEMITGQWYKA